MSAEEEEDPPSASEVEEESGDEEVGAVGGDEAGAAVNNAEPVEAVVSFESLMEAPTLEWEKRKPSASSQSGPSGRSGHSMTLVGEKLYIFGGCGLGDGAGHLAGTTSSMYMFDTGKFL